MCKPHSPVKIPGRKLQATMWKLQAMMWKLQAMMQKLQIRHQRTLVPMGRSVATGCAGGGRWRCGLTPSASSLPSPCRSAWLVLCLWGSRAPITPNTCTKRVLVPSTHTNTWTAFADRQLYGCV